MLNAETFVFAVRVDAKMDVPHVMLPVVVKLPLIVWVDDEFAPYTMVVPYLFWVVV